MGGSSAGRGSKEGGQESLYAKLGGKKVGVSLNHRKKREKGKHTKLPARTDK